MTVEAPKAPKTKAPNPQVTSPNTNESAIPRNDDEVARNDVAVKMVLSRTGQSVANTEALVAETRDQLQAEAQQNKYYEDVKLDTLTLEQLDHQKTLAKALGVGQDDDNTKELMENAKARVATLKKSGRDTSKDSKHNAIPANYRISAKSNGDIEAFNVVTGREYTGPADGLLKNL